MAGSARRVTSAVVGAVFTLGIPVWAGAQTRTAPVGTVAPLASGAIGGFVYDEKGGPIEGAVVTAIGATTTVAVTDEHGRFELQRLTPGPYVVRAHRSGFTTPRPELLDVRPSGRASFALSLERANAPRPVLAAGFGFVDAADAQPATLPPDSSPEPGSSTSEPADAQDEVAWRLRHGRRGVLKTVSLPADFFDDDDDRALGGWAAIEFLDRAVATPARAASNFFTDTPFSGQVNLLTSGSFHTPQQLFANSQNSRGIAYLKVGAPVGSHADWIMRGALTQADLSSWIVAGSYTTRAPARHRYDVGMSYSTQRYDGGNPFALRDVTDGSRNAGMVYGFDSFALNRNLTLTYGGRYARYDYLQHRRLVSPRVEVTITPAEHLRVSAMATRRAHAPGAEEFLPPGDAGIWLPPQRTFSSIDPDRPLRAERSTHAAVTVERDIAASTIAVRVFRESVDDQLVTVFGTRSPNHIDGHLGHYFVDNAGHVYAAGCSVSVASTIAKRVHGSVAYTMTDAQLTPGHDLEYLALMAPAVASARRERIHDVATRLQADVPETATRVVVLYRLSTGFAGPREEVNVDAAQLGSRFDVQVRQSLPFLNFTNARWEMLVAVRDFFREGTEDQAVYDELLVVRPPKRIVGGVTLHF